MTSAHIRSPDSFDALILGSGQGGTQLAWHLARSGQRVAVVERRWIGGSCPNVACLPTKNEIWSAKVAHLARQAPQFGTTTGPVTVDMTSVRRRKRDMIARDVAYISKTYAETGVELVIGEGRLSSSNAVQVRSDDGLTRQLTADKIFLNLGSRASIPDVPGLAKADPLTHVELLDLDILPPHLIVIGGGYIGLEMAQAFRRFGSRVTVLHSGTQVLSNDDSDVAAEVTRILEAEDITIHTNVRIVEVTGRSGRAVRLVIDTDSGEKIIEGSHALVAAGRIPNTRDIGLEENGVELNDRGYVQVNDRLETSVPGIWALGECAGSPQFTHVSVDDFRVVRDNLAGKRRSTSDRLVPSNMFIEPPVAHVGLSEREAQRQGIKVRIARLPMTAVLRTQTTGETSGFMKALVAADCDQILGFTMVGAEAGEVMATVQTAMLAKMPFGVLRDAVFAHPTMAEGLGPLFETVETGAR